MGILSKILGTGDVIKDGFKLIDDMHTSDEEEIAATAQAKVDTLKAYAPFKVAQRYIALLFTFTFLSCFMLVLGMTLFDQVTSLTDVREVISEFWIGEIMLLITSFYFGGGLAESIKREKK